MRPFPGLILLMSLVAFAHDSPEHEIEAISEKMRASGTNATLLARRAVEWRALRKLTDAEADLRSAVALDPHSLALRIELATVQGLQRQYRAALETLDKASPLANDNAQRGSLWMRRAEMHEADGQAVRALQACEQAFHLSSPELDWYLTRARLLAQAGRFADSARGLQEGFEKTGSVVLEVEWIEALLDSGQCRQAHDRIQPHLSKARWKSSWLIRRARAQLCLGNDDALRNDLRKALDELDQRTDPSKPDGWLLLDRAFAHALLGNTQSATQYLQIARQSLGNIAAFVGATSRIERVLAENAILKAKKPIE